MQKNLYAYTPAKPMPEYVSINRQDDGTLTLDVRGPAKGDAFGETIRIDLPHAELRRLFDALRDDMTPPMMKATGQSI